MKKLALFVAAFGLFVLLGTSFLPALADDLNGLDKTAASVDAFKGQVGSTGSDFIQSKAGQLIGTVLSFIGVLFLILMIYAGILWMTASGNDQQVGKAKNLMINAIIGLVIVFAAYAITAFVGGFITNQILQ